MKITHNKSVEYREALPLVCTVACAYLARTLHNQKRLWLFRFCLRLCFSVNSMFNVFLECCHVIKLLVHAQFWAKWILNWYDWYQSPFRINPLVCIKTLEKWVFYIAKMYELNHIVEHEVMVRIFFCYSKFWTWSKWLRITRGHLQLLPSRSR